MKLRAVLTLAILPNVWANLDPKFKQRSSTTRCRAKPDPDIAVHARAGPRVGP